jgi:hypothetical protein
LRTPARQLGQMSVHDATRPGELEAALPDRMDGRVVFIGVIRTPFRTRADCPRQGKADGPLCRIEIADLWKPALPFGWVDFPPSVNRMPGLIWLGKLLYPSLFREDLTAFTRDFHTRFYHRTPTDPQIAFVLESRG